ncbi:11263_t:CDS:2, partial [Dentiscutata erythropus]
HAQIASKSTQNVLEEQLVNVVYYIILNVLLLIQVYLLNGLENDFEGTSMLSSVILNLMQGHTSILSSPSGYPQQQLKNIDEFSFYCDSYEEPNSHAFQEASSFSYQTCTNTEYVMQNNNLIDNTSYNNTILLYDNLFFDNNYMLLFHY